MVQKDHTCDISISFDCRSDCALLALWRIASKWTTQTHGDTAPIQSQTTWDQGIINVRFVSRSALESNLFLCSYSTNLPPKITPVKIHFVFLGRAVFRRIKVSIRHRSVTAAPREIKRVKTNIQHLRRVRYTSVLGPCDRLLTWFYSVPSPALGLTYGLIGLCSEVERELPPTLLTQPDNDQCLGVRGLYKEYN